MSGHSKWATIKRQKAVIDSKRGVAFTKLGKNISVAARSGKDPEMNAALRVAIEKAREANMPKDNIERAIMKGSGELPGVAFQEAVYEGYGPGGVAFIVECVTDNTNRTVSALRNLFLDHGGSLGSSGSVLYLFEQRGLIRIARVDMIEPESDLELFAIDAGADDIHIDENGMILMTAREQLHAVSQAVTQHGLTIATSEIEWVAKSLMDVSSDQHVQLIALIHDLEAHDDVNTVYTNALI